MIKSIDNALAKMPKYKVVTKRELVFDTKEELLDFVNQHIAEDGVIYNAYTSTTKDEYPMDDRYLTPYANGDRTKILSTNIIMRTLVLWE